MNYVNLVAGLALSLTVLGVAYGADDLPKGAVRITAEELTWGPGRVPGQELARLIGDEPNPGRTSRGSNFLLISLFRLIPSGGQNVHRHFRHLVRGVWRQGRSRETESFACGSFLYRAGESEPFRRYQRRGCGLDHWHWADRNALR